jgi:outer membrane murein-binding lipoprotein Lpp
MSNDTKDLLPSADTLHTCSYACERPGCIRAQRDYLAAKVEALQATLAALKAENEMIREALKDADNELDELDEDMDTCDHSVGVCMCSYWSMRQKMKAALERR